MLCLSQYSQPGPIPLFHIGAGHFPNPVLPFPLGSSEQVSSSSFSLPSVPWLLPFPGLGLPCCCPEPCCCTPPRPALTPTPPWVDYKSLLHTTLNPYPVLGILDSCLACPSLPPNLPSRSLPEGPPPSVMSTQVPCTETATCHAPLVRVQLSLPVLLCGYHLAHYPLPCDPVSPLRLLTHSCPCCILGIKRGTDRTPSFRRKLVVAMGP